MAERDILYTMIHESENFEDIDDKASQHTNCKILNKIKAADNQPEFALLTMSVKNIRKMTNF